MALPRVDIAFLLSYLFTGKFEGQLGFTNTPTISRTYSYTYIYIANTLDISLKTYPIYFTIYYSLSLG